MGVFFFVAGIGWTYERIV